jgi:predicted dehydrogenase/nucleoside-diphosphate-sugar epimerase
LIGAGRIAPNHLTALAELPFVEVVAVVDPDQARREHVCRNFGVRAAHAGLADLLAEPPDIAHVSTPPPTHAAIVRELLAAGVGVLVEKPMALTFSECVELTELAARRGVPLGVNHNWLFHPAWLELRARLAAGEIGPPQIVSAVASLPLWQYGERAFQAWVFREPGNVVLESALHPISLIRDVLGDVVRAETRADDRILIGGERPFDRTWRTTLDCERGHASGFFGFAREFFCFKVLVVGPDGSLEADLGTGALTRGVKSRWPEFWDLAVSGLRNAREHRRAGFRSVRGFAGWLLRGRGTRDAFQGMMNGSIRAFHEAVRDGRPLPVSGADGAGVVRSCDAVLAGLPACPVEPEVTASVARSAARAPRGRPVLVTGASGFVGGAVVERLLAEGRAVRALLRSSSSVPPWLRDPSVAIERGALTDPAALARAVDGVDAVVHLATGVADTWAETQRSAIDATKELAAAASRAGVSRFVFTSSVAALDPAGRALDPRPEHRNTYARAKIACERLLLEAHARDGLPVVIVRPGIVVGARGPTRHLGVGEWPQDNHCLGWGDGRAPLPFVLAADVAAAIVLALDCDRAVGRAFDLCGDVALTAREYVAELARRSGRRIVFHPRRLVTIQSADVLKWCAKAWLRRKDNPFPRWRDLAARALRGEFDRSAREVLGWRPEGERGRFLQRGVGEAVVGG